ncbi:signal recognition particle-docking protein FtsY [Thermoplasmatales archaeon BRNA1]|nr:signal recognition particle-docking protein FtsY [Thermoplasmatales archaeon BRNA1]
MFDSLKSKLKGIFKKGEKLDEGSVYEEPPKEETPVSLPEPSPEQEASVPAEESPAEQPREEPKKLSKKERMAAAKARHSGEKRSSDMLSEGFLSKKIKDDPLDDILDELEVTLLESDVAYDVVQEIILGVRNNLSGKKYSREYSLEQIVEFAVREAVSDVLQVNEFDFDAWLEEQSRPAVIMFVGINGTGKTTAIAKIGNRLKNQGKSVVLAACDTFRAGAIEQLTIHSEKLGIKIVKSQQDADPASVAYDAVEHARSKMRDVVLIDTAGRMQTNNNLIAEMKKITKVCKPDLKIFVGDSLAGNDAIEQAKVFDDAIGIDAIILTKIDTDAKGGAALSIAKTIGKPIAFVCDGQEYEDIEKFDADWMLNRLFEQ